MTHAESVAKYQQAHPEKNRANVAKYRKAHPEIILAKNRKWAKEHPRSGRPVGSDKRYRAKGREFLRQYKAEHPCTLCLEDDAMKLAFHHRDPATKLFTIGSTIHSMKATLEEIAKCDVLCKDCHKKEHARLRLLARIVH